MMHLENSGFGNVYLNFEGRFSEEKDSYLVLTFESTCDGVF